MDGANGLPTEQLPGRDERLRRIADLAEVGAPTHFVPYRGGYLRAPVVEVPHHLLVYRVENGRLIAELAEHARAHGQDLKTLGETQESAPVQALLHGFLLDKARDARGPVFQELQRQAQQTEPLLVTADGVLVNGNRRLAAMRALLSSEPARYGSFGAVSAAILPADADLGDLEAMETALQLAPDTKLAYGWVNRRLKMRRQKDELGLSVEAMMAAYRFTDPADLDRELAELALAEDYLDAFCHQPGRYSLIANAEALFVGLRERLEGLPASLRRLWRLAGFTLIHGRAAVSGPLERHFPFAPAVPAHISVLALRRFAEEREMLDQGGADDDEKLDRDTQQALEAVFADASRSDELAPALSNLMERLRAEQQDLASPLRVLKLVEKLRQAMSEAQPERLSERQKQRLKGEIAALSAQAAVLIGEARAGPGWLPRLRGRR